MWYGKCLGIHGVDFGRFGLKGSHKTRSLNENENDQDGCCYPLNSESWDDASKNTNIRVARCFLNKRNLKKKPRVFAPKKEIHYHLSPYIDHYMKQSVLVECHQRGLGNHLLK